MSLDDQVGVIGIGEEANRHLPFISQSGWQVSHFYDPQKGSSLDGVIKCDSVNELLVSTVKAVFICSPDRFHTETLLSAVLAGKHVFCEKPLAINYGQLNKVKKAFDIAQERQLVISSCHPARFYPAIIWLKENLSSLTERLGRLQHIEYNLNLPRPELGWRTEDHSFLLDHLSHELDLMTYLLGYSKVNAHRYYDSFDRYDVAGIRSEDNVFFSLHGARLLDVSPGSRFHKYINLNFEQGQVTLPDVLAGKIIIRNTFLSNAKSERLKEIQVGNQLETFTGRVRSLETADATVTRNFFDTVEGKAANYLSREDLLRNLETLIALYGMGFS